MAVASSTAARPRTTTAASPRAAARSAPNRGVQKWARWFHAYASMASMLVVLFFAATGVALNHPNWAADSAARSTTSSGTLPAGVTSELAISEYLRGQGLVAGTVAEHTVEGSAGTLTYKRTGYVASVHYDTSTGQYRVDRVQQGWIAIVNDLHKGADAGWMWKLLIDVAGGFLVAVSLSGVVLQLCRKRRRLTTLGALAAGGVVAAVILYFTVGSG